jgi:hypothetical protein
MINPFWKVVGWIISRPKIAEYLIKKAQKTEYFHLRGYMERWWLFNRHDDTDYATKAPKPYPWLPSIRIHHILRADADRVPHDHPWNARTIILKGWYREVRIDPANAEWFDPDLCFSYAKSFTRNQGDTATLKFGEYHKISEVSEGGVWTLFIFYKWRGVWGFLVNGVKIPWRQYEAMKKDEVVSDS